MEGDDDEHYHDEVDVEVKAHGEVVLMMEVHNHTAMNAMI